jgi:membrane protease YdiL (CAAX protease family)
MKLLRYKNIFSVTIYLIWLVLASYLVSFLPNLVELNKFIGLTTTNLFLVTFIFQELIFLLLMLIALTIHFWYKNIITKILNFYKQQFVWKWFKKILKYSVWFVFLYYILQVILWVIFTVWWLHIPGFFWEQEVSVFLWKLNMNTLYDKFIMFFCVGLFGPLVEELIYRWFITKLLLKFWNILWIFFSALIFALIHTERDIFWNLFILSLFITYVYWKTDSIWYSLWFHILINSLGVFILFLT